MNDFTDEEIRYLRRKAKASYKLLTIQTLKQLDKTQKYAILTDFYPLELILTQILLFNNFKFSFHAINVKNRATKENLEAKQRIINFLNKNNIPTTMSHIECNAETIIEAHTKCPILRKMLELSKTLIRNNNEILFLFAPIHSKTKLSQRFYKMIDHTLSYDELYLIYTYELIEPLKIPHEYLPNCKNPPCPRLKFSYKAHDFQSKCTI